MPHFGGTEGIEVLDPAAPAYTPYFQNMVRALQAARVDVRSAPYDFRKGPDALETDGFFTRVSALVEEMAVGGRRISILSHSLGGIVAHYWLQRAPQAWKDKYIRQFIAIGTPWGEFNQAHACVHACAAQICGCTINDPSNSGRGRVRALRYAMFDIAHNTYFCKFLAFPWPGFTD